MIFTTVLLFLWDSLKLWLYNLFAAPFSNLNIFWILTPVYISLVITELFQEKKGTSRGNATSNSVVVLWGGIDFLRITVNSIGTDGVGLIFFTKIFISVVLIAYGIFIIIIGAKSLDIIKYVARIREVSYFIIIFAPLYYTNAVLNWQFFFGAVFYFPLFYLGLEVIDKFIPDPKAFVDDVKEAAGTPPAEHLI